jgi:phage terminase small subunit
MAALENDLVPATQTVISARLTLKQEMFICEYLKTRNATLAAKLAGYNGDDLTLKSIGSENLSKPAIRAEIDKRVQSRILSSNQVLAELSDVGFADWREFVEVKMKDGEVVDASLQLKDKIRALELVGKYHKLFTDRVETEISDGDVDRITSGFIERLMELRTAQVTDGPDGPTTD